MPEEVKKCNAIYDMILVERISMPLKTEGGLVLPEVNCLLLHILLHLITPYYILLHLIIQ